MRDVTDYLKARDVDPIEMIWQTDALNCHRFSILDNTITLWDDTIQTSEEENFALRIKTNKGRIQGIVQGPALPDAKLEILRDRIERNLLQTTGEKYHRTVLFSSTPVQGYWRYKDKFQILPPPAGAPMPGPSHGFGFARYPFVLEIKYPGSSHFMTDGFRAMKTAEELSYLLAIFLEGSIYGIGRRPRSHWVLLPEPSTFWQKLFCKPWSVAFCNEFYALKDEHGIEKFSSIDSLSPLDVEDPERYYLERCETLNTDGLKLPQNLEQSFDRFFSLNIEKKDSYLRAGYWFQLSSILFGYSASVSYMALIQAIEAIKPRSPSSSVCEKCGKPLSSGLTSQFSDFIESLLGLSFNELRNDLKEFYSIRSALSHGGKILHIDTGKAFFSLDDVKTFSDLRRIVRIALINWLER